MNSQDEIDAAKNLKGQDRAPDVFDLAPTVAFANTALFAPYQVAAWADIPADLKYAHRALVHPTTRATCRSAATWVPALPATVADLLKPEYKGKVALNGDPTQAGCGLQRRGHGGARQRRLGRRHRPGRRILQPAQRGREPAAGRPVAGHDRVRPDAVRHRLGVHNAAQTEALEGQIDWQVVVPERMPRSAPYYLQAINKDAPHPAAARLWEEFLYTPEGQNLWLAGSPARVQQTMIDGRDGRQRRRWTSLARRHGRPRCS